MCCQQCRRRPPSRERTRIHNLKAITEEHHLNRPVRFIIAVANGIDNRLAHGHARQFVLRCGKSALIWDTDGSINAPHDKGQGRLNLPIMNTLKRMIVKHYTKNQALQA